MPAPDVVARPTRRCRPTLRRQARHEGSQAVEQPEDVRVDGGPPHRQVGLDHPIGAGRAGVQERHVDPTEGIEGALGESLDVVGPCDVGGNADGRRAGLRELVDRSLEPFGASRREHELHAAAGERVPRSHDRCRSIHP